MKLAFPRYCLKRMIERQINVNEVRDVVDTGELNEGYPADEPAAFSRRGSETGHALIALH